MTEEIVTIDHSSRGHAKLAPSAASRWTKCLASLIAPDVEIVEEESEFAKEGTLAHEFFERVMTEGDHVLDEIDDDEYPEMAEHVWNFCRQIRRISKAIKKQGGKVKELMIEAKVKYNDYLYGTVDVGILYTDRDKVKKAYVLDFKYGRGVGVSPEKNMQLVAYALSLEATSKWEFEQATLAIFQPRNKDVNFEDLDQWVMDKPTKLKLKAFLDEKIDLAVKVLTGELTDVDAVAGGHCIFCPRKVRCRAHLEHITTADLALLDDVVPSTEIVTMLTDAQLAHIISKRDEIIKFLKAVDSYATARCMSAAPIEGLKVVHGRSTRKLLDDEVAWEEFQKQTKVNPYKKKLRGIGELEKELSKVGGELPASLVTKTTPPLKLVPGDDPRPAITNVNKALDLL